MPIKLITFDLDNTLWENHSVIERAEEACYSWLAEQVPYLATQYSLMDLIKLRQEIIAHAPHLSAQISKVRKMSMKRLLETVDTPADTIPLLVESAYACFQEERNRVNIFPQTIPLLQSLKQNYQLASLTNGTADLQRIGLAEYFSFSLSAEKVGASKPRPNLFHAALHRGDAKPHETIHIGDHPVDDIQGAQGLGIHNIWFNPQRLRWQDQGVEMLPSATVHCLSEISGVVRELNVSIARK